jgi:two-component sensor histidine kinase/putative methionine-R-sulfoxide reductase with GAF domain
VAVQNISAAGAAAQEREVLLQQVARLDALHRVHRAAASTLDLDPMLETVVTTVAEVMRSDACSVYLHDEERASLILSAVVGLPEEAIGRVALRVGEGITGLAARQQTIIATPDARSHAAYVGVPMIDERHLRAHVSVPMLLPAVDRLVGILNLHFGDSRTLDDDDLAFLTTVAGELAIAIDHARLYHATDVALHRKVAELQTLQKVTAIVTSTLDLTRVLETIAEQAAVLGQADVVSMYELGSDGESLTFLAGYEATTADSAYVREEVRQEAVRRAMQVSTFNGGETPSIGISGASDTSGEGTVFCLPLRTAHGMIGGICLHFDAGQGPTREQIDLLQSFCNTAAIAIEQARLYDDARRSLTSKSALLQEMHHRVRNNLQTVAALLSMHVRRAGEQAWALPLKEAVNRIRSIAAVHDLLTREDIGITTVNEVAKLVTDEAATTLVPPGAEYLFLVEGEPAEVSSREATVLAILINELVANAVLHGLAGRMDGIVKVGIVLDGPDLTVRVEDNGTGFPPGFRAEVDGGLGLQITQNLVSTDLRGAVTLERSPLGGGAVVLTFTPRLGSA